MPSFPESNLTQRYFFMVLIIEDIKVHIHYFLSPQIKTFILNLLWMQKTDEWPFVFTLESLLDCKIQPVHPKGDQSWVFIGRTDVEAETSILWPPHVKKPWCWGRLRAGGEGDDRGWDGWMASRTQWMWIWVNSGSWWWTGRPGVLWSMGSQRVRHDWATELNSTELECFVLDSICLSKLKYKYY